MAYKFDVLQKIGEQEPTIDESVIVDRFVDLTDVSGVSYVNNHVLTNPLTGESYNSSIYSVNAAATDALIANNPVSIDIGLPLTATQAEPQITDIKSSVGWLYRVTAYPTPNTTNQITIRFELRWGNNYSWNPVQTITLGTPAKNIMLYFVRINTAKHDDQYGLVLDYPSAEDDNSRCILLRTNIWGNQAEPFPEQTTGSGGGFGTHDNSTDVNVYIGDKPSGFLSGILGTGFNLYYVPNYRDLIKAIYFSLTGINNLTDWANNTIAMFLNPSSYIVSAVSLPCDKSIFGSGSLVHSIRLGGFISPLVDCYPLNSLYGDTDEYTFDFGANGVNMYYDSYMDFEPYTKVSLFLPYIGVVPIKASECIGGSVSVKYRFEALTGKCLAMVKTTDRNGRAIGYYQYSGNGGFNLPWVGNNGGAEQMIHSAANAAFNIAEANARFEDVKDKASASKTGKSIASAETAHRFAVAGAEMDAIMTVGKFISHDSRPHVAGGFGVNNGALGSDQLFLIIERAQKALPEYYYDIHGYKTSSGGTIGNYEGYTQFAYVELEDCAATQPEQEEILALLKSGVYL